MLIAVAGFDATKICIITSYARKSLFKNEMRQTQLYHEYHYIMNTINLALEGGKASALEAPS